LRGKSLKLYVRKGFQGSTEKICG